MIVVSDTSPLNYLISVGCIDVLPQVFGQVYAPSAVVIELGHHVSARLIDDILELDRERKLARKQGRARGGDIEP